MLQCEEAYVHVGKYEGACVCVRVHACKGVCECVYVCACVYGCMYGCLCLCLCFYMMYMCMFIYVCKFKLIAFWFQENCFMSEQWRWSAGDLFQEKRSLRVRVSMSSHSQGASMHKKQRG